MSTNFTLNENLLRYLDEELDTNEKLELEQQLNNSKPLQEALEDLKLSKYCVTHLGIRSSVEKVHIAFLNNKKTKERSQFQKNKKWIVAVAAAAAVTLFLFLFIGNNQKTVSANDLYAANYRSFVISTTRGSDNNNLETLYTEKKYSEIIAGLETNSNIKTQFLAAMSYYQLNGIQKGDSLLQKVISNNLQQNTITYKDDAGYYLGMSYLKQKKYTKAVEILEPIAGNKSHLYSDVINDRFIALLKKLH